MTIRIIPTNFALNKEVFDRKLQELKFADFIHIDFMDGFFTTESSLDFNEMSSLKRLSNKSLEVHLMALNPIKYLDVLKELNFKKVLIHIEVFDNKKDLMNTILNFKSSGFKVFLVINPETIVDVLEDYLLLIDGVMLMSVYPGKEGQIFIESIFEKIIILKKSFNKNNIDLPIQIDGGVNDENILEIIKLGVNIISVGSYILSNKNPEMIYRDLIKKVNIN